MSNFPEYDADIMYRKPNELMSLLPQNQDTEMQYKNASVITKLLH